MGHDVFFFSFFFYPFGSCKFKIQNTGKGCAVLCNISGDIRKFFYVPFTYLFTYYFIFYHLLVYFVRNLNIFFFVFLNFHIYMKVFDCCIIIYSKENNLISRYISRFYLFCQIKSSLKKNISTSGYFLNNYLFFTFSI